MYVLTDIFFYIKSTYGIIFMKLLWLIEKHQKGTKKTGLLK